MDEKVFNSISNKNKTNYCKPNDHVTTAIRWRPVTDGRDVAIEPIEEVKDNVNMQMHSSEYYF